MQSVTPFNNDVPEFQPSRESPIYPSIVRRYPCQEDSVGNYDFRSLTWKIQQPDSTMVWSSVKLVMPMEFYCTNEQAHAVDLRVGSRLPACNVALSESPMRVFRDTTLTLNGKVFNEVNFYRNILDACYRGVGPQSYGDNHSLKPIVTRALRTRIPGQTVHTRALDGSQQASYVQVDDIRDYITSNTESLLDNNGPFLERARIFQDNLNDTGTHWNGDVTSYLEIGPFQARARKGNTAVPFIRDFHLKLNFNQVESRYDQLRHSKWSTATDATGKAINSGRMVAPYFLEFGTVANMHIVGETIQATTNFIAGMVAHFTAKPYLEITYTKFLDPLRSSYLLRCYERQYEQSLPRFQLLPYNDTTRTARVTSRLLSYPTKIYLYAEVADEWKGAFLDGGVRRSCRLDNIHCRINQRPDVIYNPSQEECFETFQRHTNSSLEYGAWRKAPVYVFTPADLKQSDMYANDARITWIEWDAEVSLTPLQDQECTTKLLSQSLSAAGYITGALDTITSYTAADFGHNGELVECRADPRQKHVKFNDPTLSIQFRSKRTLYSSAELKIARDISDDIINTPLVQVPYENDYTGALVPNDSNMDIQLKTVTSQSMSLDGMIWAKMATTGGNIGHLQGGHLFMVPQSYRFHLDDSFPCGDEASFVNSLSTLIVSSVNTDQWNDPIYVFQVDLNVVHDMKIWKGVIADTSTRANQKKFGYAHDGGADWEKASPGETCFMFDPHGMRNADVTYNAGGQTNYQKMGPLTFGADNADDHATAYIDETSTDADQWRWVCFAPPADFQSDHTNLRYRWRSNTHSTVDNATTPVTLAQGDFMPSGLGIQHVWVTGAAANASVDQAEQKQFESAQKPPPNLGDAGRRLGTLVTSVNPADEINDDYQLKVLYEYGNCQYEFSDRGLPTRVIDNLIPVGPSPGIPTF